MNPNGSETKHQYIFISGVELIRLSHESSFRKLLLKIWPDPLFDTIRFRTGCRDWLHSTVMHNRISAMCSSRCTRFHYRRNKCMCFGITSNGTELVSARYKEILTIIMVARRKRSNERWRSTVCREVTSILYARRKRVRRKSIKCVERTIALDRFTRFDRLTRLTAVSMVS